MTKRKADAFRGRPAATVALVRLWSKIDASGGPDACWPWLGSTSQDGYGELEVLRRTTKSHRLVLGQKLGRELLPEEDARHTCDNPPCNNPAHLIPGTRGDNYRDAMERKRHYNARLAVV